MNFRDRARKSLILVAALSVIFASGAFATDHYDPADVDVNVSSHEGTRSFTATTTTGGALTATSLRAGSTDAPFITTVSDTMYDHVGYQLSASLSTLYRDCTDFIESINLEIGFATSVIDSAASQLEATVNLTFERAVEGSVGGVSLTTLLGSEPLEIDVASLLEWDGGDLEDLIAALELVPIQSSSGLGGEFVKPAPHPTCDDDNFQEIEVDEPTEVVIQTGDESPFLGALEFELLDGIDDAADAIAADLITSELLENALTGAVGEALIVDLSTLPTVSLAGIVDELMGDVTKFNLVSDGLDVLGQSGVHLATPILRLLSTADAPAGEYSGTMTITLLDVDNS